MFLWLSIRISAGSHGGSVINTVVSRRTPEYSGVKRMLQLKRNEFIDSLLAQCSGSTRWKRNFWYLWGDSKPWLESSCGKSQLFGHDLEKQHRKKKKTSGEVRRTASRGEKLQKGTRDLIHHSDREDVWIFPGLSVQPNPWPMVTLKQCENCGCTIHVW